MAEITLDFIGEQLRLIQEDMRGMRNDMASFRDDMGVLTAMVLRVDGKLDRLTDEMHRQADRVRKLEAR